MVVLLNLLTSSIEAFHVVDRIIEWKLKDFFYNQAREYGYYHSWELEYW